MNYGVRIGVWAVVVLLLSACSTSGKQTSSSAQLFPTQAPTTVTTTFPIQQTASLPQGTYPTPLAQRTYPIPDHPYSHTKIDNSLGVSCGARVGCVFPSGESSNNYPIGYTVFTGYATKHANMFRESDDECDAFVIQRGQAEIMDAYSQYLPPLPLSPTDQGVIITMRLTYVSTPTQQIIKTSSPEHPIYLRVINEPLENLVMADSVSCYSPFSIVGADRAFQQKDFSTNNVITEHDHGQVFIFSITSRFGVNLDDQLHPKSALQCLPDPIFGYISNGSNGGPGYPIRYEITRAGECDLINGDFRVKIIGAP